VGRDKTGKERNNTQDREGLLPISDFDRDRHAGADTVPREVAGESWKF
jgi:hypothetical protein